MKKFLFFCRNSLPLSLLLLALMAITSCRGTKPSIPEAPSASQHLPTTSPSSATSPAAIQKTPQQSSQVNTLSTVCPSLTITPPSLSTITPEPTNQATRPLVLEENPKLDPIYEQSYTAFHSGNYSQAISLANQVLTVDPKHYKSLNIKGIALSFQNKYSEGMKSIDEALAIHPNFAYGRFNKALAYEYHEEIEKALLWYDKALEIENYTWSHYGKASCYGRIGDAPNAVKNLKIAISMDKGVKKLASTERDFSKVRSSKEFLDLLQ